MNDVSDSEKFCVATVTTDSFTVGTLVTIYSFLKHHPWFRGEIVIICDELSEQNREHLKLLYDNVKFFSVSEQMSARIHEITKVFPEFLPKRARFYSLETFRLRNYEKILFLDSDLLFRGSIRELLCLKQDFVACGDGAFYNGRGRRWGSGIEETGENQEIRVLSDTFNAGLFLVAETLLTDKIYDEILALVDSRIYKTPDMMLADQVILNLYFANRQHLAGAIYNYLLAHRRAIYERESISLMEARVLHFNGREKPWMPPEVLRRSLEDAGFLKACGFWFGSYTECLEKLHLHKNIR